MKQIIVISILVGLVIFLSNCKEVTKPQIDSASRAAQTARNDDLTLLVNSCTNCHSLTSDSENQIAPDLSQIKERYLLKSSNRIEFVELMSGFLLEPKEEISLMPDAIDKYGLMSKLTLTKEIYKEIISSLYDADLNKLKASSQLTELNEQFDNENTKVEVSQDNFLLQAKEVALNAKALLGKNLKQAIKKGGSQGAVGFCNMAAIPLTDSIAILNNHLVKRVSDKPRNPENNANAQEVAYIAKAKMQIAKGKKATPEIVKTEDKEEVAYFPIMTNSLCLQCHGNKLLDINLLTQDHIQELYPRDLATGYTSNELRGIWVIKKSN